MEYTAGQQVETMAGKDWERATPDEPRFVLNARGQAFVADTLGITCDSPLTNAEISMLAEKIEQNLRDTVPHASILIQLAVVGQTSAEISRLTGMSPATASRHLRAIRRASDTPGLAYEAGSVNDETLLVQFEQLQAVVEEPVEAETIAPEEILIEHAQDASSPEELPALPFHSVTAGGLRGGIYRALKEHGVKGYGVIEVSRLSELVEAALETAAVPNADRKAYRGYLETNKPLFVDNPARSLVADVPKLIAQILVQEAAVSPAVAEPVMSPLETVEQLPPVRAVRRRVGRTAVARTPLRPAPVAQPEETRPSVPAEQLPLDGIAMNRLRGGVFRALHSFGALLPTSLEHDQLHDYVQLTLADKMVAPEVQAAYDTYLRTHTYARSDTELSQAISAMPEWIAQQIMHERGVAPSAPVQPEVLTGQKELHMVERQRQAAIATAELEAARVYLAGTDWERRQALVSVGGDMHWLSLFDSWCSGVDPETIAADSRHDPAMVRRQLLHMAKAAHREKPAVVAAAPSVEWVKDALCAQTDPEIFFPEKGGSTRDAKKICGQCAVRASCGTYADYQKESFGVWGERSKMSRKRQLPISAR